MRLNQFALILVAVATVIPSCAQDITEPQKTGVSFYLQPGVQQPVQLESQTAKARMDHGLALVELSTEHSPVRIHETRPRFLIRLTTPPKPETDVLFSLDTGNGKRSVKMTVERGLASPMIDRQVHFEFKKIGTSSYTFRPVSPLAPGEYCFAFGISSTGYLFGIDPGAVESAEDKPSPAAEPGKSDDPNQERLKKLDSLLAKGLIEKADYAARKEEILHPVPPKPITIEDRLRKLDDLLKKGLIGKPDYDKKRAEIISEM